MNAIINWAKARGVWGWLIFALFLLAGSGYFLQKRLYEEKVAELAGLKSTKFNLEGTKLSFTTNANEGVITFEDGTAYPREGHGMAVIEQVNEALLKLQEELKFTLKAEDYPVLVQFNSSGFDLSGEPVSIRRVKNGSLVYQSETMLRLVRFADMMGDGTYVVHFYNDDRSILNEKQWVALVLRGTIVEPKKDPEAKTDVQPETKLDQFPRPRVPERKD